jgi:mannonate dehydratase
MLPHLRSHGIGTICFNWMAHIGWLRTRTDCPERGGARVTGFRMDDLPPTEAAITAEALWENYEYFLRAVLPYAERFGIRLALHPDDPPVPRLGKVARIMSDVAGIRRAIFDILPSECLGLTMCQANFYLMGADLPSLIPELATHIHMVHFRNVRGKSTDFCETWHDNGELDMATLVRLYCACGIDVPIRVDHVPSMPGESAAVPGYDAIARLFAIGYLKGILDSCK